MVELKVMYRYTKDGSAYRLKIECTDVRQALEMCNEVCETLESYGYDAEAVDINKEAPV